MATLQPIDPLRGPQIVAVADGASWVSDTYQQSLYGSVSLFVESDQEVTVSIRHGALPELQLAGSSFVKSDHVIAAGTPTALHVKTEGRSGQVAIANSSGSAATVTVDLQLGHRAEDSAEVSVTSAVEVVQPIPASLQATVTQVGSVDVVQAVPSNLQATVTQATDVIVVQDTPASLQATVTQAGAVTVEQGTPASLQATVTQAGTVGVCSAQCTPLSVASADMSGTGTNAVNVVAGPCRVHSFVIAASAAGSVSFYDVAGVDTAPTNASAAEMVVGLGGSAALASPSFPAGTYHDFANGLWVRSNNAFTATGTTSNNGRVTVWYTVAP